MFQYRILVYDPIIISVLQCNPDSSSLLTQLIALHMLPDLLSNPHLVQSKAYAVL